MKRHEAEAEANRIASMRDSFDWLSGYVGSKEDTDTLIAAECDLSMCLQSLGFDKNWTGSRRRSSWFDTLCDARFERCANTESSATLVLTTRHRHHKRIKVVFWIGLDAGSVWSASVR